MIDDCRIIFFEYVTNIFESWLRNNHIQRPVILFLDGHVSRLTIQLILFEKLILVIPLYPNATHVPRPLDVGIFRPLKAECKKVIFDWHFTHDGERITKVEFPKFQLKFYQSEFIISSLRPESC